MFAIVFGKEAGGWPGDDGDVIYIHLRIKHTQSIVELDAEVEGKMLYFNDKYQTKIDLSTQTFNGLAVTLFSISASNASLDFLCFEAIHGA